LKARTNPPRAGRASPICQMHLYWFHRTRRHVRCGGRSIRHRRDFLGSIAGGTPSGGLQVSSIAHFILFFSKQHSPLALSAMRGSTHFSRRNPRITHRNTVFTPNAARFTVSVYLFLLQCTTVNAPHICRVPCSLHSANRMFAESICLRWFFFLCTRQITGFR